jgi:hemerythrin superfamily protein
MANIPDLEHDVREELEEHHVLEVLMSELTQMAPKDPQFDAKVEVLAENLLHHFEEEEEELFPRLREELDASELEALVDDLRTARENAPTEPDPDRVGG